MKRTNKKLVPLLKRINSLYEDPRFGLFTKQASAPVAVLGKEHGLSGSTVFNHMRLRKIRRHKKKYGKEVLVKNNSEDVSFLARTMNSWCRPNGIDDLLLELKAAKKGF